MNLSRPTREALLLFFAILIGVLTSIGVLGFLALIALGQWLFWPGGENFLVQVSQAPWWLKLLVPALGGLLLGPVIALWGSEFRGPGVSEVIEAAALEDGYLPPRLTFLKTLCTALTIGTGGSVGREGPVAIIGSAIGSSLARFFNLGAEKVRVALACGAAAGIAATFNAPFAGTLFAVEIILGDIQIAYLGPVALSAFVAIIAAKYIWTGFPLLISPPFEFRQPGEIGLYLLLGLLGGLLAVLFTRAISASDTLYRKLPLPEWLKPALGGLALGLVGLWNPHVFGVGYTSINLALAGKLALDAALLILLVKFMATAICLGSMSGGIVGPSLFLGAMLGTGFALSINLVFPGWHLIPVDYALVGMAALVGGTTLGPITAILIIFDLTRDYRTIIPLIISCVASLLTVKYLYGYSIYETKLLRRGVHLVRGRDVNILRALRVKDCMSKKIEILYDDTPLAEILGKAEKSPYTNFIVLDSREELSGVLTLADVRKDLRFPKELSAATTAEKLKTREVVTVTPDDDLETALNLLEDRHFPFLPVVLPHEPKKVVGLLKLEDLLTAYQQKLLKMRLRQLPEIMKRT
jgi:CIC family chloride channel protein